MIPAPLLFALLCPCHGRVPIREREVLTQLESPAWTCPICGRVAQWCFDNRAMVFGERMAA